jgi:hypothetical protein
MSPRPSPAECLPGEDAKYSLAARSVTGS